MNMEKVVIRFLDGRIIKGHLQDFCDKSDTLCLEEPESGNICNFPGSDLKAVFFVKSFEGNREYSEKKSYGSGKPKGHRIFIKFKDGEGMVGFLDGELPWEKGFFLSGHSINDIKGFFIHPADNASNNIKIFILAHAVQDVTVVP